MKPENRQFREQQTADAPIAMEDYRRACDAKLARMLELRSQRLRKQFKDKDNGGQQTGR